MPRARKHVPVDERNEVRHQRDLYALAINDIGRGTKPDHVEKFTEVDGDGQYEVRAYRLDGAIGGYVIQVFRVKNQGAQSSVYRFDDYAQKFTPGFAPHLPFLIACERIRVARERLWNQNQTT